MQSISFLGKVRLQSVVVACLAATVLPAFAADNAKPSAVEEKQIVEVSAPVTPFLFFGDVRDVPQPPRWQPGEPIKEIPRRAYYKDGKVPVPQFEPGIDPLLSRQQNLQRGLGDATFITPSRNYPGQGFSGVNPPDTSGEIGPNHYVQMINGSGGALVNIYDKSEPTPNLLASFALDTLGSGTCAGGLGDPIPLYDRFADRWVLTEFSSSGNNICMYVSQTPDPTGGYFAYGFTAPSFPDYPKYGVWPTDSNGGGGSYIVTSNESGSGVYAMDRTAMLAGAAATSQRFSIGDLPGFPFNAVTPADHDGANAPPAGAPAIIMRHRDTEVHSGPAAPEDVLEMWHFDVDWAVPANTTLTQQPNIDVAEFDSTLCGLSAFACMQQPGTSTTLDPLREVIMNPLQYQNFGDYEVLVGNFVVDVDGADTGGLRWFELRRTGGAAGAWVLHQEGTYSIDGTTRWMAASNMDQSGNIAIAYNVSSSTVFPGLRYTGRLADDPLGTMSQPETSIEEGTASNSSNRYGDYSQMGLDPADDCTFWFTGENNLASSWKTQIASFRFDACGCELKPLPLTLSGGPVGDNRVDLLWNDSELDTVVEYRVRRSRTLGGPYQTIAVIPDSSLGTPNGPGYTYSDLTVSGGLTYYYTVQASDGSACTSDDSNEISANVTGICLLAPLFDGLVSAQTTNGAICAMNLLWDPAVAECAGPIEYEVYRSTTQGFAPDGLTLIQSGVSGTAYVDADNLVTGLDYYYIVRAVDTSNAVTEANTVERTGVPQGNLQPPLFTDDAGDSGPAQLTGAAPWAAGLTGGNFGPGVYTTGSYGDNLCADLVTPSISLGTGNSLEFWSRNLIENSYDKGEVQISTDGGANWTRLELAYPGTSTNASDACGFPTGTYFTGTNTDWTFYSVDLSAYDGLTVQLRWVFSSDGSVNADGWFIDDIAVVNAPAACATASSCEENPIVDVTPNGPLDACSLSIPSLTADLSGGVGPFSYQWFQDGNLIPDATDPSYQPVDGGIHSYNVQVQAQACDDPVSDGQGTLLRVESAPRFNGVSAVSDRQQATCGIDVVWDAATSVCPGPVSYNVYRSTSPGVAPVPGNLLIAGLGGTSYVDTTGLLTGQDYHYLVQAVEGSTGQIDGNGMEASTSPNGPDALAYFDDGGDTVPADLIPTAPWNVSAVGGNNGPGAYTTGAYAANTCADLVSDLISIGNGDTLTFWSRAEIEANWDKGVVEISTDGGANWTKVDVDYPNNSNQAADACGQPTGPAFSGDSVNWTEYSADLSAFAGQTGQLRFQFGSDGSVQDNGWWIDDIEISSPSTCATAAAGPPPAPDGRNATTPLGADRLDNAGSSLSVTWDIASCTATDYNLIYGDLANVSSMTLGGSECAMGTSGSHVWSGVPSGSLFFLVVGTDGAAEESSWGLDSSLIERNGFAGSGTCGTSVKSPSGTCP